MRSFDYWYGNISCNIQFNSSEVRETLRRFIDLDLSVDQILKEVMPIVNLTRNEDLNYVRKYLESVISCYRNERKAAKDVTEILRSLNDYLQVIKRDVSNTLLFGLDKADYSNEEIEELNELLRSVKHFRDSFDLRYKYECIKEGGCENCVSYGLKGCKIKNHENRARLWGIMV